MVLIFWRNMRKRFENRYAKFGGAARRRFPAICEKPEGGGGRKTAPPGPARVKSQMLLIMHKFINKQLPKAFDNMFEMSVSGSYDTRIVKHLKQPFTNRNYRLFTISCLGPKLWNTIIAPQYPCLEDIPISKYSIKKVIRRHFL